MRKCANISPYMRRPLVIYDCNCYILNFHIYEENLIFFFISVEKKKERKKRGIIQKNVSKEVNACDALSK